MREAREVRRRGGDKEGSEGRCGGKEPKKIGDEDMREGGHKRGNQDVNQWQRDAFSQ